MVYFIPHGGGPFPLFNDPKQQDVIRFLKRLGQTIIGERSPKRIVIFSAHYEAKPIEIQMNSTSELLYDYRGFPKEAYQIKYPAQSDRLYVQNLHDRLNQLGIPIQLNTQRGWDHGIFVPLKLMFPQANIPIVSISLHDSLDPSYHLELGKKLSEFHEEGTVYIGSGSSFHNLKLIMEGDPSKGSYAVRFNRWLSDRLVDRPDAEIWDSLCHWRSGSSAEFAHPRAEHLIPIHICQGLATGHQLKAQEIFKGFMYDQELRAWAWT